MVFPSSPSEWQRFRTRQELAGMTLGRSVPIFKALQPGDLVYRVPDACDFFQDQSGTEWLAWGQTRLSRTAERPSPRGFALPAFIRLAGNRTEDIVRFASQWGPLGRKAWLAVMGPDQSASWDRARARAAQGYVERLVASRSDQERWHFVVVEPVNAWRHCSEQLYIGLNLAAEIDAPKKVYMPWYRALLASDRSRELEKLIAERAVSFLFDAANRWEAVVPRIPESEWPSLDQLDEPPPPMLRTAIAALSEHWMNLGGVSVIPRWPFDAERLGVGLVFDNMMAGLSTRLAVEFIMAVASPFGIYRCSACEQPYTPTSRTPQSGRAHYCAICGPKAAKRATWHRYKDRYTKRKGRKEPSDG